MASFSSSSGEDVHVLSDTAVNPADESDSTDTDTTLVTTKRTQFPRVWSEKDEIAILRGLAAYRDTHGGVVPSGLSHMDAFLAFIRPSLHNKEEIKNTQLNDKIRRLRQKYRAVRLRGRSRRLSFVKPHDETLYHLSSKIWGAIEDARSASATATDKKKLRKSAVEAEVEQNGDSEDDQDISDNANLQVEENGDGEDDQDISDTDNPQDPHSFSHYESDNDSSRGGEGETEEEEEDSSRHSFRIVLTKPPAEEKQQQQRQSIIQRVWSDEDEISILRGLADYRSKTGIVPSSLSHMDAFLAFVRKSLQIKEEVKKTQLKGKIRRLKEKYQALRRRGGRQHSFVNPRDEMLYHLSSKVWGDTEDGSPSDASANGNASAVTKEKFRKRVEENGDTPHNNSANAAEKKKNKRKRRTKTKEAEVEENGDASAGEEIKKRKKKKKNTKEEEEGAPSNENSARMIKRKVSYPFLMEAITRTGMMTNSDTVKRGLELADPSKAQVLEERFKRLMLLETKNHLHRASLIKKTVKLSLKSLENEAPRVRGNFVYGREVSMRTF